MLQDAVEEARADRLSEMSDEESTALQEAWVAVLEHDDPKVRAPASGALAYSSLPILQIEVILLETLEAGDDEELRGDIIREMAQAG